MEAYYKYARTFNLSALLDRVWGMGFQVEDSCFQEGSGTGGELTPNGQEIVCTMEYEKAKRVATELNTQRGEYWRSCWRAAYIPVELAETVWAVGYMHDNGITLITLPDYVI